MPAPAQPQAGSSPAKDAVAAQAGLVCIEWGGFTPDQSARARGALEKAGLRDQATQREIPERYWVYIPPLKSAAEAEKKTGELKEDPNLVATFVERQSVVKKQDFDALEKKFS